MKSCRSARQRATLDRVRGIMTVATLIGLLSPFAVYGQAASPQPTQPVPSLQPTQPVPSLQPTQPVPSLQPTQPPSRETWRALMSRVPLPKMGCFKSSYPSFTWQEVPCTTPPPRPYPPARGPRPQTVGNGNNFVANTAGSISSATGSFDSITGMQTETDSESGDNVFSLQLNSNLFLTSSCSGAANPMECSGWQQFVFANSGPAWFPFPGGAFIQYWLLNWRHSLGAFEVGPACPTNWTSYENHCYRNSDRAVRVPHQAISALHDLSLTGQVTGGPHAPDTVTLSTGSDLYVAAEYDSVLNLATSWKAAEFNVFGNCCLNSANFNDGSTIVVRTSVIDGTGNPPAGTNEGFTGETNNLTLDGTFSSVGGTSPAIVFSEGRFLGPPYERPCERCCEWSYKTVGGHRVRDQCTRCVPARASCP
jgi:hypothetical protein